MQRNIKKIIKTVEIEKRYSMSQSDMEYFLKQVPEGADINTLYHLFAECYKFGYAQGQKAAEPKRNS